MDLKVGAEGGVQAVACAGGKEDTCPKLARAMRMEHSCKCRIFSLCKKPGQTQTKMLPKHSINLLYHCSKCVLKKVVVDFMFRCILGL